RTAFRGRIVVENIRLNRRGDILNQRSSEEDVQGLHAEANSQKRLLVLENHVQENKIGFIPERLDRPATRLTCDPVTLRIDVTAATCQKNPIQTFRNLPNRLRILQQRDNHRDASGGLNSIHVLPAEILDVC